MDPEPRLLFESIGVDDEPPVGPEFIEGPDPVVPVVPVVLPVVDEELPEGVVPKLPLDPVPIEPDGTVVVLPDVPVPVVELV